MRLAAPVVLLLLVLSACARPQPATVGPDGGLRVLDSSLSAEWVVEGLRRPPPTRLLSVTEAGTRALGLRGGRPAFSVTRPLDVDPRVTPFLKWSWNMEQPAAGRHPVRLVVGFAGGRTGERWLRLVWGETALERGILERTTEDRGLYVVRGGGENAGRWFRDWVDLGDLYRRLWPDGPGGTARVVSLGIEAGEGERVQGRIAGIALGR